MVLPGDAILLHLGFHKTGTTSLQSAFAANRDVLLERGVLYPGRRRSHHPAAYAMTNRSWGGHRPTGGGESPDRRDWDRLARAARRHPGRVLISSESFALTPDETAEQMVDDLGSGRVHVVFSMRPVAALLASSWQQYLKGGMETPYLAWLDGIMAELEPGGQRTGFWQRNDYPRIVGRWSRLVGPQRVHLVCHDGSDRGFLLATFCSLLGIPEQALGPQAGAAGANRSMTAAEAELLRSLNTVTADWDWPTYQRTVRTGVVSGMVEGRVPGPDEVPTVTPLWAVEAASGYGRSAADVLGAMGVVVHGDLEALAAQIPAPDVAPPPPTQVPIDAAVESVLGAATGARRLALEQTAAPAPQAAAGPGEPTTRELAAQLAHRIRRSARRRLPRPRRRG